MIPETRTDESATCCLIPQASTACAAIVVSKRSTALMGGKESFSIAFKLKEGLPKTDKEWPKTRAMVKIFIVYKYRFKGTQVQIG